MNYVSSMRVCFEGQLLFHIQETSEPDAIKVVLRKKRGYEPLGDSKWRRLVSEKWRPGEENWRAFPVVD